MNTAARKAKGREGQKEAIELIMAFKEALELQDGDLTSRPMGSLGDDVIAPPRAYKWLYFRPWEIKRRKRIGIVRWMEQAVKSLGKNCTERHPVVCFREDRGDWYCTVRMEDLLGLLAERAKNDRI